jgi:hypothetical protein
MDKQQHQNCRQLEQSFQPNRTMFKELDGKEHEVAQSQCLWEGKRKEKATR